ncbi:uncharacterized protein Z518_04935 [Rhinocladiella mackenziei CBS 650.93]|uniref:Rhinocladiella mackenziei CBS 650.93 unplaced genomic scaffold supercont1.3, whole genome shotgun sequence n=1 Tax=Rhinocladiella mackenziei CBS 650.93 TaxID=1442369 RepID=A0A0D2IMI1_9EURO|nr:uncharacterized protein Z518_04935 [Rhinocladiella mackenziei CBS 650.93]KIX06959.1 hypothetical protein Z518_04935 [Rhinocladiella mackenziei CBS 650.93]
MNLPALDTSLSSPELRHIGEVYDSMTRMVETASDLVTGQCPPVMAGNDTIDPAVLRLNMSTTHHDLEQTATHFQSRLHQSPGSRTRLRCHERSRSKAISRVPRADTRRKRMRRISPSSASGDDASLRHDFTQSLEGEDENKVEFLCDLYRSVASPDSMSQLKDVVSAMRRSDEWTLCHDISTVVNTVKALDKLDTLQQSIAFVRRILLLHIVDHRKDLLEELKNSQQDVASNRRLWLGGKVESIVLDKLVQQAYPHTVGNPDEDDIQKWREKYEAERKRLKNRLSAARNWRHAVDLFGLGIIALVPSGGDFHIQNQRFETLRQKSCEVLLTFLGKKGNGYVRQAAARLTPFVQAVYDGKVYVPKLAVEFCGDFNGGTMDPSKVVELCEELPDNGEDSDSLDRE